MRHIRMACLIAALGKRSSSSSVMTPALPRPAVIHEICSLLDCHAGKRRPDMIYRYYRMCLDALARLPSIIGSSHRRFLSARNADKKIFSRCRFTRRNSLCAALPFWDTAVG